MIRTKMLGSHRRQLQECLGDTSREQAAFLFTHPAVGVGETVILVREIMPLQSSDFVVQGYDILSVHPSAMLRAFRRAQALNAGVCMVHTHPMADTEVYFSGADDRGNLRTFTYFCELLPDALHSCLVFNGALTCVAGRVHYSGEHWVAQDRVEIIDDDVRQVMTHVVDPEPAGALNPAFQRQVLLLGPEGQRAMGGLKLVVAGAGGIGSVAAIALAHSGAGRVDLVDPDVMGKENRPRQIAAEPADVDKAFKVSILERYLRASMPEVEVEAHPVEVQDASLHPSLVSADAIVVTTDSDSSRAWINEFCARFMVPLLDLGVEFDADPQTGEVRGDIGKVNLVLPGHACLLCIGHLNPLKITWECLPEDSRQNQVRDGYVRNWHLPQPSSMAFNMEVAARGVQRLMGYFTGLLPAQPDAYERFTFLTHGGLRHHSLVRKHANPDCILCSQAHGVVGHGAEDVIKATTTL